MHALSRFAILLLATSPLARVVSLGGARDGRRRAPAIGAKIAAVQKSRVFDSYEAVGTVASVVTSPLASRVLGQVTAVRVREGDRVRAGQVLVEIEARDGSANVARAKAGLTKAEQGAHRSRPRHRGSGTVSSGGGGATTISPK